MAATRSKDPVNPITVGPGKVSKLRLKLLEYRGVCYEKDIAIACGMHPTRLSEYASGKKPIPVHHLTALCKYFKCSPYDILGEAEETEF